MTNVRGYWRNGRWVRPHFRRGGAAGAGVVVAVGAVVVAVVASGGGGSPSGRSDAAEATRQAAVVRTVVDGDTLRVRVRGRQESVRLLAVDTPEVARGAAAGDCYADEAEELTRRLVDEAERVVLISDPTQPNRDKYDRLLRYVDLDGADLGRALVDDGAARVWVGDPPAQKVEKYRAAEAAAQESGLGQWGQCPAE